MPLRLVLFDLDETLIDDAAAVKDALLDTCRIAAQRHGVELETLYEAVREQAELLFQQSPGVRAWDALGLASWEVLNVYDNGRDAPAFADLHAFAPEFRRQAWTRTLQACRVEDPTLSAELAEAFPVFRKQSHRLFPDALTVLDRLFQDFRLVLVTNGASSVQREKIECLDLGKYFDFVVVSGELGIGKPDARIFHHALELCRVEPEDAVVIGDSIDRDVAGGYNAGLPVVWLDRLGAREALRRSGHRPAAQVSSLSEIVPILLRAKADLPAGRP